MDTVISLGPSEMVAMVGKVATNYQYTAPSITIYSFLFLMFLFGIVNEENEIEGTIRGMHKIIFVFVLLAVMVLIYTALYVGYNTVGHSIIWGIQGRYFIPITGLLCLSLSNKQFLFQSKNINMIVYTIIHSSMYALLLSYLIQING